jgi:hypothetical protein
MILSSTTSKCSYSNCPGNNLSHLQLI